MISKLYNTMLFSTVNAGKVNKHSTFSNSCLSSPSSNRNHDRFVFSEQSEHLQISGTSLQQSSRSVAQKTQARNIPSMLAAKIAGLKTNGTGSPIINSKFDYEAYNSANGYSTQHWATIMGKENGKYQIIDPRDGTKRNLDQMEIYKNNGSVLDYVILTNEY